jgi:hypothetical protein
MLVHPCVRQNSLTCVSACGRVWARSCAQVLVVCACGRGAVMGTVPFGGRRRLRRVKVLYRFSKVSALVYLLYNATTELSTFQKFVPWEKGHLSPFLQAPLRKNTHNVFFLSLPPSAILSA